ncbi:NAD-dependent DNA ligase LigA [Natronolimnohabitans innermongolicus]|uniref:DNA ligase n=1 Tax=Natronolimnohabitans innermongolicus JCM 12255 TaxID=1227499 RepID=L9WZ49_9EURY|nr:NAD-dependent DNA ligase LigA [Natronolimnohabitans innermongolicus]ELY54764.1 NAD-dependent DNA ligase LigA [Natronolimnohabitans innermongolicus JCM 12255]
MARTDSNADGDNPYLRNPPTDFEPVAELTEDAAREQVELLRAAIREHDRRYYVENDPLIADRTYDALFARLQELEDAFDCSHPDSPTRSVGGEPIEAFDTVEHVAPMLSIDQSGEDADVREFADRVRREVGDVDYVCEPKFDGVSMEFVYENGSLERAVTRGDGREGDDVTRNARTIGSVPQTLHGDHPDFLAVRGEVYMPKDAFQAYNRERIERGEEPFANPRNATAGTIRQLDPAVVAERPLEVFYFDVLEASDLADSHREELERFPEWGLRVTDHVDVVDDIEDAIDYRDRMLEARDDLNYEIDGTVIKVDDRDAREKLGRTARHDRYAFAYKFPARAEVTPIVDVAVQVGRTGRLTPVALLEPVDVGGVTVSRASLHNPEEIAEKNVNIGDTVRVQRAGDVIPYVEEVVEKGNEGHYELPDHCPVCDSAVERDGPMAFCTGGLACDAQLRRSIEYYASDDGLDLEGLGEKSVRQLVDAGLLDFVSDLYELESEELTELEGWGETSAENLLSEIESAREPPLSDFLSALGIPHVGPTTARELAREFGTFEAFRETAEDDPERLEGVDDVGETVAAQLHEFFASEANADAVDDLLEHVSPQESDLESSGDALEGLTVVFTGSLEGVTRGEAQETVETHGANTTSSVSGNTDYLVVGENPGQTKQDDAEANDVSIVDEDEFRELLAEQGIELE